MRISVGNLRSLLLKELGAGPGTVASKPSARAVDVTQHAVDVARDYVDSLMAGEPDKESEREFKELAKQSVSLAKWMLGRHEKHAEEMARFARVASTVSDNSGFWKRPAFLNQQDYIDKMKKLLDQLDAAALKVLAQ